MCSYDGKTVYYHEWIGNSKKNTTNNKKLKFLAEMYPSKKMSEIDLLTLLMPDAEFKLLALEHGMTTVEIKNLLKK